MTLNLKEDAGREIFLRLAKDEQVLNQNYRPDVKHRLGIDYENLQKLSYALIAIMLIFNFLGSTVVYEEEIDMIEDPADVIFYLDEIELKAGSVIINGIVSM